MNETQHKALAIVGFKGREWLKEKLNMSSPTLKTRLMGTVDFKLAESALINDLHDQLFHIK